MQFISNPPDAASLMTSARSFGNYDLPSALADLIDNSIKARARNVHITCLYQSGSPAIRVLDDGYGMSRSELHDAMRPASTNPAAERSPDDLGRFGWGMKSASFSQCKKLTVISSKEGSLSGAEWDLDEITNWKMGVLTDREVNELASRELLANAGTEIVWSKCDRLSEHGSLTAAEFNDLVVYARDRIALVYHRYLGGAVRGHSIKIFLNGQEIKGYDPFYSDHRATQQLEIEEVRIENKRVRIQPYILPHYSKITLSEYDRLGGEEGFLRNQGFYVYRNHRLIINGTWFRLAKHGELSQLVRISVDIPNSLDGIWKITIDKGDAQLPAILRNRLKGIVDGLKKRSSKVFRSKGGRLDRDESTVWQRHARNGEIHYSINREHPLIASFLAAEDDETRSAARAVVEVIEQSFPVIAFSDDVNRRPLEIRQTETNPRAFRDQVEIALPLMLNEVEGDFSRLSDLLRRTEPYSSNWAAVEEILKEKGWTSARAR